MINSACVSSVLFGPSAFDLFNTHPRSRAGIHPSLHQLGFWILNSHLQDWNKICSERQSAKFFQVSLSFFFFFCWCVLFLFSFFFRCFRFFFFVFARVVLVMLFLGFLHGAFEWCKICKKSNLKSAGTSHTAMLFFKARQSARDGSSELAARLARIYIEP